VFAPAPIDREAAAAYALATAKLRDLTADLALAEGRLVGADSRLSLSAGHIMRMETAATVAARLPDALSIELDAAQSLLASAHLSVDGYARRAYQDGAAGAWSTVLAAEDADDFADRATDLQTVADTRGHAVDLLTGLPGQIAALESSIETAEIAAALARDEVRGSKAAHKRQAREIARVAGTIEPLREQVAAAVIAAKAAIPEDQALQVVRAQQSSVLASEIVARSAALEATGNAVEGTGSFARPATGVVTSDYGYRTHPILGYVKLHTGVDYDGADGVVYAADDGVVLMTVRNSAYGNVTVIDHGRSGGRSFATFYAHQAEFYVGEGEVVTKGQPIGAVGSTGMSTGPHLHFEVRLDGVPVDPRPFLVGTGSG
jgi:murein DD-endopeptidase MepM/ murein hydrolase activator NlpD